MIFPLGALVNGLAIGVGGGLGLLMGTRLPEQTRTLVFQALGLCVVVIGMQAALQGTRPVAGIGALVTGCILGEALRLEEHCNALGERLKARLNLGNPTFTQGLVNASVIFCIGAMGILGSLDEGLRGSRDVLLAKAVIDGFIAMMLAARYGVGVLFSGVPVFLYQGVLTMGAASLHGWLTPPLVAELTSVGGVIILGIGLNMLELTRIRLANMIPALPLVPLFLLL